MESTHTYTPVRRLLLALLVALLMLVPLVVFISPAGWFVSRPVPTSSADEDAGRFKLAETRFEQARTRLAAQDWQGAHAAYAGVAVALRYQHLSTNMVDPRSGQTAKKWYAQQQERLAVAMAPQVEPLLQRALTGSITLQAAIDAVYAFPPDPSFLPVRERFETRRRELAPQMVARAQRTLRVVVLNAAPQFGPALRAALQARWPADQPYLLSFDPPWGPADNEASWKVCNLEAHTRATEYTVAQPADSTGNLPESIFVTEELSLEWRTLVAGALPSNWDELPTITVTRPTPRDIINQPDERAKRQALVQRQEGALADLWQQALAHLAAIPPFEIFSQVDLAKPLLNAAGQVDTRLAFALALRDPRRFEVELAAARTRDDAAAMAQLAALIVRKQLTAFAPWVLETIPHLDRDGQRLLVTELAAAPGFGAHAPLLLLIRQGNDQSSADALRLLLRDTPTDDQLAAVTTWLQDSTATDRDDLAASFLRYVDERWLPHLANWLQSPQAGLAARAVTILRQRAPALLDQALIDHYDQLSDKTRLALLEAFVYDPVRHGPAGADMLLHAARQTVQPELRQRAVDALAHSAATTAGWQAGHALLADAPADLAVRSLRTALIRHAHAAAPDPAAYLLAEIAASERLRGAEPAPAPADLQASLLARDQALQALLTLPAPPAALAQLAELLQAHADDAGLASGLIAALAEGARLPAWDWDAEHAQGLLGGAAHSAGPAARKLAYLLMGEATRAGHPAYRRLLEGAQQQEGDAALQEVIKRQLAP